MNCLYCDNPIIQERVDLGYSWCTTQRCVELGLRYSNKIVLVCGHKSIYQPMFVEQVATQANHPKHR